MGNAAVRLAAQCALGFLLVACRPDQSAAGVCLDCKDPDAAMADAPLVTDAGAPREEPDAGPACVPTEVIEQTCDAIDNNCDGVVDNVDLATDGICDCLQILIVGRSGAHAATEFETWLASRGTHNTRTLDSPDMTLSPADLAGIDVVVLDFLPRSFTEPERALLVDHVRTGGGLISLTGYDWSGNDASYPNDVLTELGASYNAAVRIENTPADSWENAHPVGEGLSSVTVSGGYEVTPLSDTAVVVARAGGVAVGVAMTFQAGRAFAWGDEWIEYDSEWTRLPDVNQLWVNLLEWIKPSVCSGID